MKNFRLFKLLSLVVAFLLSFSTNAQSLTIKRLNTSTINIGGKTLKVGDSFNRLDVVNWASDKQALIAKDASGKMYRLSAASVQGKPGFSFEKLLGIQKSYNHLSTRALGDDDIDSEYILDDVVSIPTGMDEDVDFKINVVFIVDGVNHNYTAKLSEDKSEFFIDRDIFKDIAPQEIKIKFLCTPSDDDMFEIASDVTLIPIELAID